MKSFFEDLGRKIGETAETVTNKAGEAVEVQRLKNQIRALERGNERDYMELGRIVYDRYKAGEVVDAESIGACEAIQNREESIEKYEQQISDVKGDVPCDGCGKSVAKDMAYCPYCGAKVPEDARQEGTDYSEAVKEKVVDMAEKVKETAEDVADTVKEKADAATEAVKEKTADKAEDIKDKTVDMADTMCKRAESAADAVKERAADVAEAVKDKASQATEVVKEKAEEAEEKIKKMTED